MKRILPLLLALLLFAALAAPAAADVLFEPDDAFYRRHSDECQPNNRSYYTNGADGYVLVWTTPTGSVTDALPNGDILTAPWTWKDEWACLGEGWVRLSDLAPRYDSGAFFEDHGAEIAEADETLAIDGGSAVWAYRYPGSGEAVTELPEGELYLSAVYTDSAGRRWGYCGYYMAIRSFWVCLDDPANGALPPDENAVVPELVPAADDAAREQALAAAGRPTIWLYAGAACAAVLAAAIIVVAVKKKRKA